MKIAMTGASGLVGSALQREWTNVVWIRLVRRAPQHENELQWQPGTTFDASALNNVDAVIHLAGAGIADERWSKSRKRTLISSRVDGTQTIADGLAKLSCPPPLISASGIGYYGHTDHADEDAPLGSGFLASLCRDWEAATANLQHAGGRVILARFGMVLSSRGGALAKMLPVFRLGAGGPLGTGTQSMSWIHEKDVASALRFAIQHDMHGPLNLVAPRPVSNRNFSKALGNALGRPAILPAPAWALRTTLGREFADEMLLTSLGIHPKKLIDAGFEWRYPELSDALEDLI